MAIPPTGRKVGRPRRLGMRADRVPWRLSVAVMDRIRSEAFRQEVDPAVLAEQLLRVGLGMAPLNIASPNSGPDEGPWCDEPED